MKSKLFSRCVWLPENTFENGFRASTITNLFFGSVKIVSVITQFLIDSLTGYDWMLSLSSIIYTTGLGLLWISTPPVLSKVTGNCSNYKPKCIGHVQTVLFQFGLVILVVAISGYTNTLEKRFSKELKIAQLKPAAKVWLINAFPLILVNLFGLFVLSKEIKSRAIRFGVCAIFMLVAAIIFIASTFSESHDKPVGSLLAVALRVFVASASKIFHRCPDAAELYERIEESGPPTIPHTDFLRFLDKAAIIIPGQSLEEQERNRWKLCTVTEAEKTKRVVLMIPICMTFFSLGLVTSNANTYFLEQARNMNPEILGFHFPVYGGLLAFYGISQAIFSSLYNIISVQLIRANLRRFDAPIGIGFSMILGVLCLLTSAKVEHRRLEVVKSQGLTHETHANIPMSFVWLLPQYFLIGGVASISSSSIKNLFSEPFMENLSFSVYGIGVLCSILIVDVLYKVTSMEENGSWFQSTINTSRLDKYYLLLCVLVAITLVVYIFLAFYLFWKNLIQEQVREDSEDDET